MKQKRTLEFKVDVFKYYLEGIPVKECFLKACLKHNTTLSGCMTKYAASYMSDDIRNYLRKKMRQGCERTKSLMGDLLVLKTV